MAAPGDFQKLSSWSLLGLPVAAWAMFLAFLVGAAMLNYTAWGRRVLAIGGNVDAARLMGLPVARTTFSVYVLSGALAGCAGVFLGSQNGSVDTAAGQGWELTAIAAVVVGGTLLTGGVGSVLSSLVGVLLLQLIFNLIVFENGKGFINISSFWESVIRGAFLLVVVLLQVRLVRRRRAAGRRDRRRTRATTSRRSANVQRDRARIAGDRGRGRQRSRHRDRRDRRRVAGAPDGSRATPGAGRASSCGGW